MAGIILFVTWYFIGLFGAILGLWYRYRFLYKEIKLVNLVVVLAYGVTGPFVWLGILLYILIEVIDWDMTVVHKRDRY